MNCLEVAPNLSNFVKSLRDIGYTFEVAVADIIDNSITAKAKNIKILAMEEPILSFSLLDDGFGMNEAELIEAMRIATKDPDDEREKRDLGRFGLGLKTASFSQCKKLTVISKKNQIVSAKKWDLDFISKSDKWLLINPDIEEYACNLLFSELVVQNSGTLVIWEEIDKYEKSNYAQEISRLIKHLSLVFHRFLDNYESPGDTVNIFVNNKKLTPFNPFNPKNSFTQEHNEEKIFYDNKRINVKPYILPHFSKLSQQEYELYETDEGYIKTQGFYLYREKRLLIYGTWWGLNKASAAHKLVRIKIDISNDQDNLWGIDLKKATAKPIKEIKEQLKNIIKISTEKGSRLYTGRGKTISDPTVIRFWDLQRDNNKLRFIINKENPIYKKIFEYVSDKEFLKNYFLQLQEFLPLDAILAEMQNNPHNINQVSEYSEDNYRALLDSLLSSDLDKEQLEQLLKLEVFKHREDFLDEIKKLLQKN